RASVHVRSYDSGSQCDESMTRSPAVAYAAKARAWASWMSVWFLASAICWPAGSAHPQHMQHHEIEPDDAGEVRRPHAQPERVVHGAAPRAGRVVDRVLRSPLVASREGDGEGRSAGARERVVVVEHVPDDALD